MDLIKGAEKNDNTLNIWHKNLKVGFQKSRQCLSDFSLVLHTQDRKLSLHYDASISDISATLSVHPKKD